MVLLEVWEALPTSLQRRLSRFRLVNRGVELLRGDRARGLSCVTLSSSSSSSRSRSSSNSSSSRAAAIAAMTTARRDDARAAP
ncbi:hypothetical protein Emag_004058 [Eimeria magna]